VVTEHWKNCHRTLLDSFAYKRPPNEGGSNSKIQRRKPDRERSNISGWKLEYEERVFWGFWKGGGGGRVPEGEAWKWLEIGVLIKSNLALRSHIFCVGEEGSGRANIERLHVKLTRPEATRPVFFFFPSSLGILFSLFVAFCCSSSRESFL
jgi:hypothetical protein